MNPDFMVAYCDNCERDVLLAVDLDDDHELVRRCVHCDQLPLAETAADAARLSELGYVVPGQPTTDTKRGCRDGQCGVRQPSPAGS